MLESSYDNFSNFAEIRCMKCKIKVFLMNEHFSQEHADANFGGEPSENNRKYDWEDEMNVTSDVQSVVEHRKASFPLAGVLPNGESFSHDVKEMMLFEIISDGLPSTYIGCSESILEEFKQEIIDEVIHLTLCIKDFEPHANPIPGIYIASKEFPKELIF